MVSVAGASYNDPGQGTRGGSIILPSRFLSILIYFSIIFCGCTQSTGAIHCESPQYQIDVYAPYVHEYNSGKLDLILAMNLKYSLII